MNADQSAWSMQSRFRTQRERLVMFLDTRLEFNDPVSISKTSVGVEVILSRDLLGVWLNGTANALQFFKAGN